MIGWFKVFQNQWNVLFGVLQYTGWFEDVSGDSVVLVTLGVSYFSSLCGLCFSVY